VRPAAGLRRSVGYLVLWIVLYLAISALVNGYLPPLLLEAKVDISPYMAYINIGLALAFGYMIVRSLADTVYWSMRARYAHPQAVPNL